ncbi:MAG: sigma-70 family RNA polymerase sigma factor [Planctomycetes bacterium]|jgi:RNA polymerase sigma-70 factor (ECF subfamily)|nr:sigma-70 family RNA polymerase sigma factor [Planctomycetota bacterium]
MTDVAPDTTSPEPPARPAPSFGEELIRAHQAALWRWLRVLGARAEEAEDLAQETFVVLLRTPFVAEADGALRAWLRTTARNLFLAHCRRQRRTPIALDAEAVERAFAAYERDDDGAGYREALARCLETLPPRQHELLEAALHGEEPLAAIAGRLALGVEALRSLLRRSKQALRDCVQRRLQR